MKYCGGTRTHTARAPPTKAEAEAEAHSPVRGGQQMTGVCTELQVKDPGASPLQPLLFIIILRKVFKD